MISRYAMVTDRHRRLFMMAVCLVMMESKTRSTVRFNLLGYSSPEAVEIQRESLGFLDSLIQLLGRHRLA
jgi:hypothetical protein